MTTETPDPSRPPSGGVAGWWRRSPGWQETVWTLGTMVASLLAAAWVLGLWRMSSLAVPISADRGDIFLGLSAIKGMLENGWYLNNPALGAPGGQELADFGGLNGDNLYWLMLRVLGFFITDPVVLLNVFFLLGFALAGGVAYLVLRDFGTRRLTALAMATFYANLSFHFTRGEGHLMLGMYFVVPAAVWLVLRVLMGSSLIRLGNTSGVRKWLTGTNIGTALAVIAIGGSTIYYAFFTLVLLVIATVIRGLATRKWRAFLPGAAVLGGVGAVLFVNLLPGIAYRVANGANPGLAERIPYESFLYSVDLTRLVFMVAGHRIERFSNLGNTVAGNSLTTGEGDILGLVLGATFLVMLLMLAVWIARGRLAQGPRGGLLNATVLTAGIAFLMGTTGGLGAMFAVLVTPQIRAWTRITPFLAFLCLIVLAMGVDWLRSRIGGQGWRWALAAAVPVVVAGAALWDGTSPSNRPNYEAITKQWNDDQRFVDQIDASLPKGGQVLQLPMQPFPEAGGIVQMGDYEHLVGYVHSGGLSWSYGAMKGRPEDWTAAALTLPTRQLLYGAAAAGFNGLWIDRAGYEDKGAALERAIQGATGLREPTAVSSDGRRVFYNLEPLAGHIQASLPEADRAELAAALTTPVESEYGEGFYGPEKDAETDWRWATNDAIMTISNGTGRVQQVRWTAGLRSAVGSRTTITVDGKVVQEATFETPESEPKVNLKLAVPARGIVVRFRTEGPNLGPPSGDPRALFLKLMEPRLVNETFARAEETLLQATAAK